mmetsp:Transcript_4748/g.16375  ORF Transcript_4748/g.16375 Transcript_4748/m.16375 type:complete len:587 (-) Transcript_4748:719-2479(-)
MPSSHGCANRAGPRAGRGPPTRMQRCGSSSKSLRTFARTAAASSRSSRSTRVAEEEEEEKKEEGGGDARERWRDKAALFLLFRLLEDGAETPFENWEPIQIGSVLHGTGLFGGDDRGRALKRMRKLVRHLNVHDMAGGPAERRHELVKALADEGDAVWKAAVPVEPAPARPRRNPSAPKPTASDAQPLRVASWNVSQFTDNEESKSFQYLPQRLNNLAATIAEGRFDVVALQEVKIKMIEKTKKNKKDDSVAKQLANAVQKETGELWAVEETPHAGNSECFAFLYNTAKVAHVETVLASGYDGDAAFPPKFLEAVGKHCPRLSGLQKPVWNTGGRTGSFTAGKPFNRTPAFSLFTTNTEPKHGFLLCSVHLLESGAYKELEHLRTVFSGLCRNLECRRSADESNEPSQPLPLLLMGDFNLDAAKTKFDKARVEDRWNGLLRGAGLVAMLPRGQPTNLWPAVQTPLHYDDILVLTTHAQAKGGEAGADGADEHAGGGGEPLPPWAPLAWVQHWPALVQNTLHDVYLNELEESKVRRSSRRLQEKEAGVGAGPAADEDEAAIPVIRAFKKAWSDHRPVAIELPLSWCY